MSGIVGMAHAGDRPIDRALLERMTSALRFRGPDAHATWVDRAVGFGHTLFATTEEAWSEKQPCTLDGQSWIVADARLDARDELIDALTAHGRAVMTTANDAELLLHAYGAWGDAMVDRLLGDFAFAVWDRQTGRLFCARDQFGVKPFFYAAVGPQIVFSNTLECVRLHPSISDNLNESAIADFLLFYFNQDVSTTVYADIQRLPSAHTLAWDGATLKVRRYWRLAEQESIRYRRQDDYIDHFKSLLTRAVTDRLRTKRVGVLMSGGLDSSSVAATAKAALAAQSAPFDLKAFTIVYDRLLPDRERHYAGLVAGQLGIPIQFHPVDDYPAYHRCTEPDLRTPEPMDEPQMAQYLDLYRAIASSRRVVLTGSDLDTVMHERPITYLAALARRGAFGRLGADVWRLARAQGGIARIGIRTTLREWFASGRQVAPSMPGWINEAFIDRPDIREHVRNRVTRQHDAPPHPLRPRVSRALSSPPWMHLFEGRDPGVTQIPLELRHPFADLRLVHYLLSIPLIPWCDNKMIVRKAMHGILPDAVLSRPKSPLAGDPLPTQLRSTESRWIGEFRSRPELTRYVVRERIPPVTADHADGLAGSDLRPFSLNNWLTLRTTNVNNKGEQNVEHNSVAS
jgi:asparagine synthase (glutamine-hydrolysing)